MKDHHPQNGTAAPASSREHQQVWETLPWLANGTASSAQRLRATAHLADCAACRQEFDEQQRLMQAMASAAPSPGVDIEAGLQRLMGRLDAPPVEQPLPSHTTVGGSQRERSRLAMALAVAVVVQAIGLGVLSVQRLRDDSAADYRTLSQQPAQAMAHASLQVMPSSSMTMADWQRLLQAHGLRIVDGPNAVGSYALAPAASAPGEPIDVLLARLRATPGVRLAEPIGPPR